MSPLRREENPELGLCWDGNRRLAVIGPEQSGATTTAYHLLQGLTRLGVPAIGLDQSRRHTFATLWRYAHTAISGHGYWPEVRRLRRASQMAALQNQAVVVDVGHSRDVQEQCACLVSVIVLCISNRDSCEIVEELGSFVAGLPANVPRVLVYTARDPNAQPNDLLPLVQLLGVQDHFEIPYWELMATALAHGQDVWSYRSDTVQSEQQAACQQSWRNAVLGITEKLCGGSAGWRNSLRDSVVRHAVLDPTRVKQAPKVQREEDFDNSRRGPRIVYPNQPKFLPISTISAEERLRRESFFGPPTSRNHRNEPRGKNAVTRQWAWLPRCVELDGETASALTRIIDMLECDTSEAIRTALRYAEDSVATPLDPAQLGRRGESGISHKCNFQLGPKLDSAWCDLARKLVREGQRSSKSRALRWAIHDLDRRLRWRSKFP